jgi:hypothetical protein
MAAINGSERYYDTTPEIRSQRNVAEVYIGR